MKGFWGLVVKLFAVVGLVLSAWLLIAYSYESWNFNRFAQDNSTIVEMCLIGYIDLSGVGGNGCLDCSPAGYNLGWPVAWTRWLWG